MDDLIKKIEALRDLTKALLSKPGQANLVPALKIPAPKPISMPAMPSMSAAAPKKIPGITPPSNKDPKAVAAQLKNPKPKKPKMEILKFDQNGQWSLQKSESGTIVPDGKES